MRAKELRILHVLRDFGPTGVPMFVSYFVNCPACQREQIRNTVFSYFGGPVAERVKGHAQLVRYEKRFRFDVGVMYALRNAYRRAGSHLMLVHSNLWGLLAALLFGLPTVYVLHVAPSAGSTEGRVRNALLRRLARRERGLLVAVSNATARTAEAQLSLPDGSVRVIPNGIPNEAPRQRAQAATGCKEFSVACVGSLCPVKGQHVLIAAISALKSQGVSVHCHFAGHGPSENEFRRLARELHVQDLIHFHGYVPVEAFFIACRPSAVIVPSLSEPFGFTTLEAWRDGIPVIASAVDGPSEVIEDGVSGLLFPPGDAAALGERILRLQRDRDLLHALACGGRLRLRAFSMERCVQRYRSVADALLAAGRAKSTTRT